MIDVVIVTAGSNELVLRCLRSLHGAPLTSATVVENAGTEDAAAIIESERSDVRVIVIEQPLGLARAYNRGAAEGSAELVLFLNDDILAEEDAVATLAQALGERPDAVAAAGRLVNEGDGATQVEYQPRPFPTLLTFLAAFGGVERVWRRNPWTGTHRRRPLSELDVVEVDQPPGACLLVRRSVFEAVGGWDERFEFWYEDVDLARRLRRHGRVLYVPTAPFRHVGGHTARRLDRAEVVSRSYRGALLYADKHFGPLQRRATGGLFAAVSGSRALVSAGADAQAYRRVAGDARSLLAGRHVRDDVDGS